MFGYKVGDIVKINCKDNEWNGLNGIIDKIEKDIIYIYSVEIPYYYYKVAEYNIDEIEIVNI